MSAMGDPLPPNLKVIGRYSLLRELRRERNTVTYEAVDPVMNRSLIVKAVQLVRPGETASAANLETIEHAFVRQAQAAGRLHHPHIVTVFDAGRSHTYGFLVIERIAGRPLHDLLARGLRLPFVQCASITARICDALAYAHSQAVAHRNLGPQHVFLMGDGSPKVAGFGGWIDSGISGDEALAHTEVMLPYFDSEITAAVRYADARAAAVLLYMMLTGRAPSGPAPASGTAASGQMTGAGRTQRALPLQSLRADAPTELATLVDTALDPTASSLRTPETLRDALTAFIWANKSESVSPSTIGMPLAAAPAPAGGPGTVSPQFPRAGASHQEREINEPPERSPSLGRPAPSISGSGRSAQPARLMSSLTMATRKEQSDGSEEDRKDSPASVVSESSTLPAFYVETVAFKEATQRFDTRALGPVASFRVPLRAPPPLHSGAEVPPPIEPERGPDVGRAAETAMASIAWQIPGLTAQRTKALQRTLTEHRFSFIAFGVVIVVAMAIGLLLGTLAGRGASRTLSTAQADANGGPGPVRPATPSTAAATNGTALSSGEALAIEGLVRFEIVPWGEVLVDNRPTGVAPPLVHLMLPPGRHLIEIRHPNRPAWTGQVEVDATRPLVIRHSFN